MTIQNHVASREFARTWQFFIRGLGELDKGLYYAGEKKTRKKEEEKTPPRLFYYSVERRYVKNRAGSLTEIAIGNGINKWTREVICISTAGAALMSSPRFDNPAGPLRFLLLCVKCDNKNPQTSSARNYVR